MRLDWALDSVIPRLRPYSLLKAASPSWSVALPSSTFGWTCGHPCSLQWVAVERLTGSTLQASTLASEDLFHLAPPFPTQHSSASLADCPSQFVLSPGGPPET